MDVRLPDGTIIQNVPDGTTKADLVAKLKANGMSVPAEWLAPAQDKSIAVKVGDALSDIPRQVGLTGRYLVKSAAAIPAMLTDAVTGPYNSIANLVAGEGNGYRFKAQMPALDAVMTRAGVPEPADANERVIGDIATTAGGAGTMVAGAAKAAANAAPGVARNALAALSARPGVQLAGAAGAGGAGGAVREAGGGPGAQFLAALGGGVAAGSAAAAVPGAVSAATRAASRFMPQQMQAVDQQISLTLQRSGIDWAQVPERIKQGMRQDVADALNTGQPLNADALRRLLVFRSTGTTPTVGMLTQDPGLISREMNLAKAGANSTDQALQRLPAIQNANAAQLLRRLDESGAAGAPDAMTAGGNAIASLAGNLTSAEARRNALYAAARDTSGRSAPLDGATFTRLANERLAQALAPKLGSEVDGILNDIATGRTPLTVEYAEQLKTALGRKAAAAQGTQGDLAHAYGIVRRALDETPLQPAPQVNPGNLPAVPGTVPASPAVVGQESIDAFNAARAAHRALMQRIESNPALRAVHDGVQPDQFVSRFVVGKGASANDVAALAGELSPAARESMRQYLVRYLRDAATNSTDDVTKFSSAAYSRAFRGIADKMPAFFNQEEMQALRDVGRAATYMQAQPVGSAVNNSNSGALLIGKGVDLLSSITGKLPLGLKDTINGTLQGYQQRQALTPANALALKAADSSPRVNPLLAATIAAPVQAREDNRRK